jgi:hypothetical protein
MQSTHSLRGRVAVAFIGTLVAATLAVGALAISHSATDDLAARKLSGTSHAFKDTVIASTTGGGKPVR